MNSPIHLKQFRVEGCLSYVLYDGSSRQAVIIDPHVDAVEKYSNYVEKHGLKPAWALDTHIHADHFSATHLLREKYHCEVGMSEKTASARPSRKLKNSETIRVGAIELKVLETPGHTPDSVSYFGHGMVFTGDTLFIGSSGRTDFPGADPKEQWKSIHRILGGLPDTTLVMPGHDYNGIVFSTLAQEKKKNPHWMPDAEAKFVAMKEAEVIATADSAIRERVEFNKAASPPSVAAAEACATACGVPMKATGTIEEIPVAVYTKKFEKPEAGAAFIDVREPDEFANGHIPGARNIPLSDLALHLSEISASGPIYLNCQGGGRSMMAAKTLSYLGYGKVVNIAGGFRAWAGAGLPVEK